MSNASTETASNSPLPLKSWLWRSYLRAALVPLLLIELTFVGLYWGTSRVVYDRSAAAVTDISTAALDDASGREAEVIARRLQSVSGLTQVYADEASRALSTPAPDPSPEERAKYAMTPEGVMYMPDAGGGSAIYYSGYVEIGPAEEQKVWRSARLDPIMTSIKEADPLIAQLYINTHDSLNRIYPPFDVLTVYPPKMDISSYNFYYEADATHNPDRKVVWTDAYVDPAGAGWMVSAIAPSYALDRPDFLEGVVGIDITIDTIVDQVLDIEFQGDGYAILVGRDGTILALPPEGEGDLGVTELIDHSYEEVILQDTFKPDTFNLYRRAELFALGEAIQSAAQGQTRVDLGRPMIAAWATIAGPQWKLIVLTSEESLLSGATELRDELALVSWAMLAILIVFYLGFFLFLWRRSVDMSARVAQPLAEIEGNMIRIAEGGTAPPGHAYAVTELQTVGDYLVQMGERLQAANRAKANFLSAMSHEFRTPLNAIIGFSELMASNGRPLDPDQREQIATISNAGFQMLNLVDGVIELARIDQGEGPHTLHPIDPRPAIRQAVDETRRNLRDGRITLHFDDSQPVPAVMGDAGILERILAQLLSNGVKYNRDGGSVTVTTSVADDRLAIHVRDTGIGIAADLQPRLFTPFDRLGHENGIIGGTGIGLTICQRLAEQMGAAITFESREGKGSTFTLRLALA